MFVVSFFTAFFEDTLTPNNIPFWGG